MERGRVPIESWDDFKKELRGYFLPHNAEELARDKLMALRHTGSISEYVAAFSAMMLDI